MTAGQECTQSTLLLSDVLLYTKYTIASWSHTLPALDSTTIAFIHCYLKNSYRTSNILRDFTHVNTFTVGFYTELYRKYKKYTSAIYVSTPQNMQQGRRT